MPPDPREPIDTARAAVRAQEYDRAESALLEALSRVRQARQEVRTGQS